MLPLTIGFTIESLEMTKAVIEGETSLGGSESAMLALAEGLAARGHEIHVFSAKLGKDAPGVRRVGTGSMEWHAMATHGFQVALTRDLDVLIALRHISGLQMPAKLKILWCEDLMPVATDTMKNAIMSVGWAFDLIAYVSDYHQRQWEAVIPELKGAGWATLNPYFDLLVPKDVPKNPNQIVHVSRPERGLEPLLAMWPAVKAACPDAELVICRYESMYDTDHPDLQDQYRLYDKHLVDAQAKTPGIRFVGNLAKPALYQLLAESALMWYPGVAHFGETSCIAAIEAQACGTPFVGSFKGALPETVPSGRLIAGDATTPEYQLASVAAVVDLLNDGKRQGFVYRSMVKAGRAHAKAYTRGAVAELWEQKIVTLFDNRFLTHRLEVLDRLVADDDYTMVLHLATEILADAGIDASITPAVIDRLTNVVADAERVIAGLEHTASDYGANAVDPLVEIDAAGARLAEVVKLFKDRTHVLDVACGSGAFAIALCQAYPEIRVTAVDYSASNIAKGHAAGETLGFNDRIHWVNASVWNFETQQAGGFTHGDFTGPDDYDGLWIGEFVEHVADCQGLIDHLESLVPTGSRVVITMPYGPLRELIGRGQSLQRGHVHHFRPADLDDVFGRKTGWHVRFLPWQGVTPRGNVVGNWLTWYDTSSDGMTGSRKPSRYWRLRPYQTLSAGLITNETVDLRRCLESIWATVDEIVIGNCGANQAELDAIVQDYPRKTRVIDIGPVDELPKGFSEARNRVLAATTGQWFFWIDSDERLVGANELPKYLDGPLFNGVSLRQNNVQLDQVGATAYNTPVRLFRRSPAIQFYGCIHEQPQMGDANTQIAPCLAPSDVQIIHTGYLTEDIRRHKALWRNLPLLARDKEQFPDRELGKLFIIRDFANLARFEIERADGRLVDKAQYYFEQAIAMFEKHFLEPTHRYHAEARPFYEWALRPLPGAIEVEVGLIGHTEGLGDQTRLQTQRLWFRTKAHAATHLRAQLEAWLTSMSNEKTLDCEPVTGEPWTYVPESEPVAEVTG